MERGFLLCFVGFVPLPRLALLGRLLYGDTSCSTLMDRTAPTSIDISVEYIAVVDKHVQSRCVSCGTCGLAAEQFVGKFKPDVFLLSRQELGTSSVEGSLRRIGSRRCTQKALLRRSIVHEHNVVVLARVKGIECFWTVPVAPRHHFYKECGWAQKISCSPSPLCRRAQGCCEQGLMEKCVSDCMSWRKPVKATRTCTMIPCGLTHPVKLSLCNGHSFFESLVSGRHCFGLLRC